MRTNAAMVLVLLLMAPAVHAGIPCPDFYRDIYQGATSEPKVYYSYQTDWQDSISCAIASGEDDPNHPRTVEQLMQNVLRTKQNAKIYAMDSRAVDPGAHTLATEKVAYEGPEQPKRSTAPERVSFSGQDQAPRPPPSQSTGAAPRKPREPKAKSSSPGWGEVLLGGLNQVAGAYAAKKNGQVYVPPPNANAYMPRASSGGSSSMRAPLAPASCATYRTKYWEPAMGSAMVEWRNTCSFPIEVNWCWVQAGQSRCKTDNAGDTIPPGGTDLAVGPSGDRNPTAAYFVCDMSEDKLCTGYD